MDEVVDVTAAQPEEQTLEERFKNFRLDEDIDAARTSAPPAEDDSSEEVSEPAAATPSIFDSVLPDDPELPAAYRGKMTVRELFQNERALLTEYQRAREETNRTRAENELFKATLQAQMNAAAQMPAAQAAPPKPPPKNIFEALGINPEEVFDKPGEVIGKPLEALQQQMNARDQQIWEYLQQQEAQRQAEAQAVREERLKAAARQAWQQGREIASQHLGYEIDPKVWGERTPDFLQFVVYDQSRENPMVDPGAYAEAFVKVAGRWGASAQAAPPPEPRRPANPPHSTRGGTSSASAPMKLPKQIERNIAAFAQGLEGWTEEQVREAYLKYGSGR